VGNFFQELRRRNLFRVAGLYCVVSWILIQIGAAVFPAFEAPTWVLKVFITVIALGFPFAMIFAWAFEMTPDGVKPTKNIKPGDSISHITRRKLDYVIIGGLGLVAALIIADNTILRPKFDPKNPNVPHPQFTESTESLETFLPPTDMTTFNDTIAVLPFVNRSVRQEDAYFAAGIHDDLLTQLSKISALQVISRTSVMRYANTETPIPEIAAKLGVSVILEGSVQRSGERVRINVQLIDGLTDTHLWAEKYNRKLTTENLFEIQEEITLAIADAMEAVLTGKDLALLKEQPTHSIAAYDAYIRGQLLSRGGISGADDYIGAIKAYDEAVAEDPNFAAAYAGKAYSELYLYWLYGRDKSRITQADKALQKAKELAPNAVETLLAEAYYNYWGLLDYAAADQVLNQALIIAPNNADLWAIKAYVARRAGRFNDTITGLEKAHRLDPLKYIIAQELASTYSELGMFTQARDMMERAKAISPASQWTRAFDAHIWWQRGDADKAWETINVLVDNPDVFYYKQMLYFAILTRNKDNIEFALETWPKEKRAPKSAPETYNLLKYWALRSIGDVESAQKLLRAINVRIAASENPYPSGWAANAPYFPVTIPGLSGDLRKVGAAVRDYEKAARKAGVTDAWGERDILSAIARAYAQAGDPDAAFAYIEKLTDRFGPAQYPRISIDPAFDNLRQHPDYLKLKAAFEAL